MDRYRRAQHETRNAERIQHGKEPELWPASFWAREREALLQKFPDVGGLLNLGWVQPDTWRTEFPDVERCIAHYDEAEAGVRLYHIPNSALRRGAQVARADCPLTTILGDKLFAKLVGPAEVQTRAATGRA